MKPLNYSVPVSRRGVSQDTPFFTFQYQAIMFTIVYILSKSQFDTINRYRDNKKQLSQIGVSLCSKTENLMTLHNMPPKCKRQDIGCAFF